MSDDGTFYPNADVPVWVNVVIPILCGTIFIIVVILLYRTEKEVPRETLIDWANRIPVLNKWLLPDDPARIENKLARDRNKPRITTPDEVKTPSKPSERTYFNPGQKYGNSGFSADKYDRYDSISSIRTHETSGHSVSGVSERSGPSYYASQGTLVSFETNV